ncbi:hypothetical protein [Scytonema sp. NUACC26]|uniref:hypothetical protein n=1 Tax=Scytonema sp. NUACC26 TaxID=3140176 RepID=UPI0038B3880B
MGLNLINIFSVQLFAEISIVVNDVITSFLDEQFQKLSPLEINIIYWIALRRNSASLIQLRRDTIKGVTVVSPADLFNTLDSLIEKHSLVDKNKNEEDEPDVHTLDLVILKYITNLFVEQSFYEILQIIENQRIKGYELFLTHSFITENPENEELTQEQIKRIIKPIHNKLLIQLQSQQRVEEELSKISSLLEDRGFSQEYAHQNILYLISDRQQLHGAIATS